MNIYRALDCTENLQFQVNIKLDFNNTNNGISVFKVPAIIQRTKIDKSIQKLLFDLAEILIGTIYFIFFLFADYHVVIINKANCISQLEFLLLIGITISVAIILEYITFLKERKKILIDKAFLILKICIIPLIAWFIVIIFLLTIGSEFDGYQHSKFINYIIVYGLTGTLGAGLFDLVDPTGWVRKVFSKNK